MLSERHFDSLYQDCADPWGFRTRWYEQRKRALVLAALPDSRYLSAIEAGCANGELAAALAPRCDSLLACDFHDKALDHAARRLAGSPQVRLEKRRLPRQWPAQRFDLAVISELGYYLAPEEVVELAQAIKTSLAPGGVLLACHWRPVIDDAFLKGDAVHRTLQRHTGFARIAGHVERDFRIDVWAAEGPSMTQREGLA